MAHRTRRSERRQNATSNRNWPWTCCRTERGFRCLAMAGGGTPSSSQPFPSHFATALRPSTVLHCMMSRARYPYLKLFACSAAACLQVMSAESGTDAARRAQTRSPAADAAQFQYDRSIPLDLGAPVGRGPPVTCYKSEKPTPALLWVAHGGRLGNPAIRRTRAFQGIGS